MVEDSIPPEFQSGTQQRRPAKPAVRRPSVRALLVGPVVALLLGMALTLQVLAWSSVATEAGGRCGGRYGSCPQGSTPILVLSLLSLFPLIPIAVMTFASRVRSRDLPNRLLAAVMVVLAVAGFWPAQALYTWAHGTTLHTLWTAQREPDARLSGQGAWSAPGLVVRARQDRLTGYDLRTGGVRFSYVVPDPQLLCAMSRTAENGVGLLAYGPEGGGCQTVVALDLGTGRALWTHTLSVSDSHAKDYLAISGNLAMVGAPATLPSLAATSGNGGIQALDLRTGALRWHTEVTGTCSFQGVGDQASALVECVNMQNQGSPRGLSSSSISYSIRRYDATTGRKILEVPLPYQASNASIDVLSYAPLVVHIRETNTRGTDRVESFGDDGRERAHIDVTGIGNPVALDITTSSWDTQQVPSCVISQGVLVVTARQTLNAKRSIRAYDLSDGTILWDHSVGRSSVQALTTDGDQAVVLTENGFRESLTGYGLRDGKSHQLGRVMLDLLTAQIILRAEHRTYAILDENGNVYPPVAVVQ